MSYLAKQKLFYYKKYKIDIWGFLHNTLQVLEDNTIYKVYNIFKKNNKLLTRFKELKWEYGKFFKIIMKSTVKMVLHFNNLDFKNKQLYHYVLKINFDKLQERKSFKRFFKLKKLFNEIVVKNLLAYNLWEVFMKQTISKRLCNIYNILLPKSTEYIKIFYRRPFIYEPRVAMQSRRKYKKNEQFVLTGIVKLFYVMYSYKQLKKIAIKAKLQNGVIEHNYISFIESKLPSYVYRMSFFPTLFDSLDFVKGGNVWVNKEYKSFIYYHIKLFDMVGFRPIYKSYIVWSFFKRLRRRAFLFMFPECVYISLAFLFIILIKRITCNDIINTFDFDYYRIVNYLK